MSRNKQQLVSLVPNHIGICKAVWLNKSNPKIGGCYKGVSGYFKLIKRYPIIGWIKYGEDFHGYIDGMEVKTSEGLIS